jgi:hypothetical protein
LLLYSLIILLFHEDTDQERSALRKEKIKKKPKRKEQRIEEKCKKRQWKKRTRTNDK